MSDLKRGEIIDSREVKKIMWSAFDMLRNDHVSSDHYHVVLFFLTAYKDKLISVNSINNVEIKYELINQLHIATTNLSRQYHNIIENYLPIIESMSVNGLSNLISLISNLDYVLIKNHFSEVFDKFLFQIARSQGKRGGEFMQPLELSRLMFNLGDVHKDSKVFNPFAGVASFGVNFEQIGQYYGQEINRMTWCLGALRLMAYGKLDESSFLIENSIERWPDTVQNFDLVISNPPFGMRLSSDEKYYISNNYGIESVTVEQFLIKQGIHSLNHQGKLIILLPQGFLYRGGQDQRLRKELVDSDLIDTIISLPAGLLYNTGISTVVLVLNRNKKHPNEVKFYNAQDYFFKNGSKEIVLDDDRLLQNIVSDKEIDGELKFVDVQDIVYNDYNLNVSRYFKNEITVLNNEKLVKLKDVIASIRGQKGNLPSKGKLIRVKDLKQDKIDFTLDLLNIEKSELNRPGIYLVPEFSLLLTTRGNSLRPTLFDFNDETVFSIKDILAFKVNESIVDRAYLVNELYAEYVQKQLDAFRIGSTAISTLRLEDLLEVGVKLPSIEVQRAKVQGIYELADRIKILEQERVSLEQGVFIKEFNEFASLKHTLGRPRQNILDWADNLLDFMYKRSIDIEDLNNDFSDFYDIDIVSALKEIKRDVNFITDVLEKGENGLILSEYKKQLIPLSDINSLINDLSNNGFNFRIKKLLLSGEKLKERGVLANAVLLKTLIDNVLTNANKYAFDDDSRSNEVVVELIENEDSLSMEIRNNGKPFPRNFDREKFIAKYSTADLKNGSGLGGYDINRIASDFGDPDWMLMLNEDPLFPVKFKFQLPIKPIN